MNESSVSIRRIVLIVVILLAGIGAGWGWTAANKWTKERSVRAFNAEVDNLFEAFHQYKTYVGSYPSGNSVEIAKALLEGNNPKKIIGLSAYDLEVVDRVSIELPAGDKNADYLRVKRDKMGHLLELKDRKI